MVVGADGWGCIVRVDGVRGIETQAADLALIVRAVNAHDELAAALTAIAELDWSDLDDARVTADDAASEMKSLAMRALAKARA